MRSDMEYFDQWMDNGEDGITLVLGCTMFETGGLGSRLTSLELGRIP